MTFGFNADLWATKPKAFHRKIGPESSPRGSAVKGSSTMCSMFLAQTGLKSTATVGNPECQLWCL